jgi:RHS repeat-associated protein
MIMPRIPRLGERSGSAQTAYTYDNNGNTLSRVSATDRVFYLWDAQNRLTAVDTNGDGTIDVENSYDPNGIRTSQISNGQETRFLIDAETNPQVLLEYRPGGLLVSSYVYGNGLLSQQRGADVSYYHADALSSTLALTNASGQILNRYVYDAFGKVLQQSGNTPNSYLFAGQQRDFTVGLDYMRARYFDSNTGRFTAADPLRGYNSDPLYVYAMNNPVNWTDPSGMFTIRETLLVQVLMSEIQGAVLGYYTGGWQGALAGAAFGVVSGGTFGTMVRGVGLTVASRYGVSVGTSIFASELAFNLATVGSGVYDVLTTDGKERTAAIMGLAMGLFGFTPYAVTHANGKKGNVSGTTNLVEEAAWKYVAEGTGTNITVEGQGPNPWTKKVRIEGGVGQQTGEIMNLEGSKLASDVATALQNSYADIKVAMLDKGAYTPAVRDYIFKYGGNAATENNLVSIQIWERSGNGIVKVDSFGQILPPSILQPKPASPILGNPKNPPPPPPSIPASYAGDE